MKLDEKFDPLVVEYVLFAKNPNYNLIEKCLKLAQVLEYPDLDISKYIQKINEIGKSLMMSVNKSNNVTYNVSMLNEHLFHRFGFKGDTDDFYNPKNNFLNEVIERKVGIPITLSIIYSEVARHIGLNLKIVGFPSHVIVKYDNQIILDPFNQGKLLDKDELIKILEQNFGEPIDFSPNFLDEIQPEKILIRIVRNLKNSFAHSYAYQKAMRCANIILALEPNSPEDIRDKGILEDRLLNHGSALHLLKQYLDINPDAEDADFVLELIRNIRNKINL